MKREVKDYYQILGLPQDATLEEIRKAYRTYASKLHPDKHDGDTFFEERFKEVKEAYDTLSDNESRWRYDIRKFKKSKVKRQGNLDHEAVRNVVPVTNKKIRFDIPHLEVYVATFYLINLSSWIMIKKIDQAPTNALIFSLFLGAASSLVLWLAVIRIRETVRGQGAGNPRAFLGLIILALCLGGMSLVNFS